MDDDIDEAARSWRSKPKDSFQNELQAKLRQRKYQGMSVDVSDSDDNDRSNPEIDGTKRPTDYRRRRRQTSDLSHGLGTQTMRTKDLSHMLNDNLSEDDDVDEEIIAANLGRSASRESVHSGGLKTPSPKQESKYLRKPARKEHSENVSASGRKTPVKDTSPHSSVSKEDGLFGRRTPVSKEDRSITFHENEHEDKQWQPPKYRTVSPKDREPSRGSRGVSPIDSSLDRIGESAEEKLAKQILRGQREGTDVLSGQNDKPKPQVRGRAGNRRTSPHAEQQRKSPSSQEATGSAKRTTPTLDIFGQSRSAAAQELEEYMESNNDKETKGRKTPTSRSHTPEMKPGTRSILKTPDKSGVKFDLEEKKSKVSRKSPRDSPEIKTPWDKKSSEKGKPSTAEEPSLLDFLMEDDITAKPKPQARGRRSKGMGHTDFLDDIFGNTQKRISNEERTSPGTVGRKSPAPTGRKTPEYIRKSPVISDKQENIFKTIAKIEQTEDTSSICEEIPPDPYRKLANQENRSNNQTTERAQADDAIETVAITQTLKHIAIARKIRSRTVSAKVQHRPKPRYGDQLNKSTNSLQEHHFNSTGDIREAIYEEWYKIHLNLAREKKKEEEKKAKEEEEKKKKEVEDKRLEAELSYKAWMEQKKKKLQEVYKEKEKKEKLEKERLEQEKKEQIDKSRKVFETWKGKKDAVIKTELQKKIEEAKKIEREKKQELLKKQKERESVHKIWLNKKETQHVIHIKQEKKHEKNKRSFEEESKDELKKKEKSAENIYLEWLEKKENQAKLDKVKARRKLEDEEEKPAWSPASRIIPFGR
ncbi:unnamed protein product [Candidula unifasciata]|uniref:Microtubule-associated protein 9 n=1 Tax=Candidula unifasciata TaxID=100452 RepID=A0A8S3Z593_9EUPU|nr:unnamed protein product [Candidula unifasciata]